MPYHEYSTETKDVHSDKAWEGVWAAGPKLGSVVPKWAVGRSSRIKITVKHQGGPLQQTDHYKGLRNLTATLELSTASLSPCLQKPQQRHLGAVHHSGAHTVIQKIQIETVETFSFTALKTSDLTWELYENLKGSRTTELVISSMQVCLTLICNKSTTVLPNLNTTHWRKPKF